MEDFIQDYYNKSQDYHKREERWDSTPNTEKTAGELESMNHEEKNLYAWSSSCEGHHPETGWPIGWDIIRLWNAPLPDVLPPHHQGSSVIAVDCNWKSCRTQTLCRGIVREIQHQEGRKKDYVRGNWRPYPLHLLQILNTSWTFSQINIKPHTEDLLASAPITQYIRWDV